MMAFSLSEIYTPLTASPYQQNERYTEIPPCKALRPYVRCFWGTAGHSVINRETGGGLVIPDTCMDIIVNVNFTRNRIDDWFCGINNCFFVSSRESHSDEQCTFAIRFYAWSVILFADSNMYGACNAFTESGAYFGDFRRTLCEKLADCRDIHERARAAEIFLLNKLEHSARTQNADVMNALYGIIRESGRANVDELARDTAVSRRTLERLFASNLGVSPKQLGNLLRYQMLWRAALRPDFNVHDAVYQFGYFDQAHLLHDFKKYHGMSLGEAQKLARFYKQSLSNSDKIRL